MKAQKIKINMDHFLGEVKAIENAGYKRCNRLDACIKVVFIDEIDRRQVTVYFKSI